MLPATIYTKVFGKIAVSSKKPVTYAKTYEPDGIIRGKFYRERLIQVIYQYNPLQESWFQMHLRNYFQLSGKAPSPFTSFNWSNWIWRLRFRKYPTNQSTKMLQRENSCFLIKSRRLPSGTWFLPFHYGFCWRYEHSHSRKIQTQRKLYYSKGVLKNSKRWDLPWNERSSFAILVRICDTCSNVMLAGIVE